MREKVGTELTRRKTVTAAGVITSDRGPLVGHQKENALRGNPIGKEVGMGKSEASKKSHTTTQKRRIVGHDLDPRSIINRETRTKTGKLRKSTGTSRTKGKMLIRKRQIPNRHRGKGAVKNLERDITHTPARTEEVSPSRMYYPEDWFLNETQT